MSKLKVHVLGDNDKNYKLNDKYSFIEENDKYEIEGDATNAHFYIVDIDKPPAEYVDIILSQFTKHGFYMPIILTAFEENSLDTIKLLKSYSRLGSLPVCKSPQEVKNTLKMFSSLFYVDIQPLIKQMASLVQQNACGQTKYNQ